MFTQIPQSFQVKLKAYLLKLIHLILHWKQHILAPIQNSVPENPSAQAPDSESTSHLKQSHIGGDRGIEDKLLSSGISAIQMHAAAAASKLPKTQIPASVKPAAGSILNMVPF